MTIIIHDNTPAPQNTPRNDSHSKQNTTARTIEVLSIAPGETPGVLAVVAVKVGGIVIKQVRVTNRGRGTFINFPSRKIGDKWIDLIEIISPPLRAAVVDVILAAVRQMDGAQ